MSVTEEVKIYTGHPLHQQLRGTFLRTYPSHLNCPYCPAQAFIQPDRRRDLELEPIRMYVCPQRHRFYAPPEQMGEKDDTTR